MCRYTYCLSGLAMFSRRRQRCRRQTHSHLRKVMAYASQDQPSAPHRCCSTGSGCAACRITSAAYAKPVVHCARFRQSKVRRSRRVFLPYRRKIEPLVFEEIALSAIEHAGRFMGRNLRYCCGGSPDAWMVSTGWSAIQTKRCNTHKAASRWSPSALCGKGLPPRSR